MVTALLVTALPAVRAGILSDNLPGLPTDAANAIQPADAFLEVPAGPAPTLPANPVGALIDGLKALASDMGIPNDPTPAVLKAALSPETAGYLALLVNDVLGCERLTRAHYAAIPASVLKNAAKEYGKALNPSDFNNIRSCAAKVWKSTGNLENALTKAVLPAGSDIDLWPVLRYTRSVADNTYLNDYAITVDAGGDDTYVNNAGGNMIDLNFGPPGQPGLKGVGPAKGCQRAIPSLTAADCSPLAGVLIDLAGNDRYGVKQSPEGLDTLCTADPIIRRMVTNGAGFLGVSVQVDRSGNDVYTGKTGSNGAGHIFGVGILHDKAGNDTYLAVRNSTGFALVGGLGVFRDYGGDDTYDYYMPAPLDPNAPNQTNGAGGVIDDEDACDNLPRYDVGGANVAGVGVALDNAGNDRYRGGFTPDFLAPAGTGRGGSLGFGNNGASGVLLDLAGVDTYTIVGNQGSPTRGNGVTILPNAESTGTGAFRDAS